ncbi:MAG: hypothetical protein WC799_24895, partial [Desulfobacteraceae bacterium]
SRFGSRRFHQLLLDNTHKPFEEQGRVLLQTFNDYKGEHNRQDDVTVVGFSGQCFLPDYHLTEKC